MHNLTDSLLVRWAVLLVVCVVVTGCGEPAPPAVRAPVPVPAAAVVRDKAPSPAFHAAALNGRLEVVKVEVDGGVDVNARNADGHTALMLGAFNGHAAVIELLLDAGADPALRDAAGRTALMFAATGPYRAAVELLIKHGAKVNDVDGGEHWTPLMFAAAEGQADVVAALLAAGADLKMRDTDGDTARDFAARRGYAPVIDLLTRETR